MKRNKFFWLVLVSLGILQGCSDQKPAVTGSPGCALDGIDGAGNLPDGIYVSLPNAKLRAVGWMADINADQAPREVSVVLQGPNGSVTTLGKGSTEPRPDVAAAYNKPALVNSGYFVTFELGKALPSGTYDIVLNGVFDNRIGVCNTNKKLKIGS